LFLIEECQTGQSMNIAGAGPLPGRDRDSAAVFVAAVDGEAVSLKYRRRRSGAEPWRGHGG
jgi:hypothetical protein